MSQEKKSALFQYELHFPPYSLYFLSQKNESNQPFFLTDVYQNFFVTTENQDQLTLTAKPLERQTGGEH